VARRPSGWHERLAACSLAALAVALLWLLVADVPSWLLLGLIGLALGLLGFVGFRHTRGRGEEGRP
jgi:hypothetical protein